MEAIEIQSNAVEEHVARQALGLLKIAPLATTDPNDHASLVEFIHKATIVCHIFRLHISSPEALKNLSLALEQWGVWFPKEQWAMTILGNEEMSGEERINELYRAKIFSDAGPEALDFSTYCILTYKQKAPEQRADWDDEFIHFAANMGLKIAQKHDITDLTNTYLCVEMILYCGDIYTDEPEYQPLVAFLADKTLSPREKTFHAYHWLIFEHEPNHEQE